jgi:thiosulfate/3-mercaptopyruvate sulfurtransferase
VVPAAWLGENAAVVADVRWYLDGRSGRGAYEDGHLPGAVFVDLETVLAAPASAELGRHPLPGPDVFAAGLAALGIGDTDVVVAYDDAGGVIAARLVWLLRAIGHEAALLDGGLSAWDGPLETGDATRPPAHFTPVPWPADRLADIDDAMDPRLTVLDARPRERFRGELPDVDPRLGHIPGSRNVPCRENLGPDGRFLPPEQLRQVFLDAGVTDDADVVSSCGSGVTACHNLLSLELAGFPPGRLYPGSWSQYAATDHPVAT